MFKTLPGFRDFYPEDCSIRNHVFAIWRSVAQRFGFLEYDTPVLEPLGLYTEKSGNEIVGQLFRFEDQGGRAVAMRPEVTPSLARMVGVRANSLKRPIKWFTIGEQYRYERQQKGRLRAFYQLNVDILGESGVYADAELMSEAIQTLEAFGLTAQDIRLRLSDRDLWSYYLQGIGVSKEDWLAVLSIIDKFERQERASSAEQLEALLGARTSAFLEQATELLAVRTLTELQAFFDKIYAIFNEQVQKEVQARIEDWQRLIAALRALGMGDYISIDFGIVRGLAYYTGFVFEIFEVTGQSRALAGGGRYDGLIKKLGYPDLPASGFAMGDVVLCNVLQAKGLLPDYAYAPDVFVVSGGDNERQHALASVAQLRAMGHRVEYSLKIVGLNKQLQKAIQSGARIALIYGSEELASGYVTLRHLASRKEQKIPANDLVKALAELL